ncbi:MAG: hypothetical protein ABIH20_01005 [Candidatus Diapherotrites archaeon]
MDLVDLQEREARIKQSVKKNCMLCMGRAHLGRQGTPEKDQTQDSLKELYNHFEIKFRELRKADAEGTEIQRSGENKRFVLDVISTCNSCDMEEDRANRSMNQLK